MSKKLFQQHWFQIFFGFIIVCIIAASVLQVLTPKPVQLIIGEENLVSNNFDQSVSSFNNLIFLDSSQKDKFGDKTVGIYSLNNSSNLFLETSKKIIDRFNLTLIEQLGAISIYSSNDHSLELNTEEQTLSLTQNEIQNYPLDNISTKIVNEDSATLVAKKFIEEIFPDDQFLPSPEFNIFYQGQTHIGQTTPNKATLVEVAFSQSVESIPILIEQEMKAPILVLVNSNNQIVKTTIIPTSVSLQKISESPLISVSEAVSVMNEKQIGSIIYSQVVNESMPSLSDIVGGTLNLVVLEYRLNFENRNLIPFYRFFGTLENSQGEMFKAEIITPAIASTKQ